MCRQNTVKLDRVLKYFYEIASIPHGSENMTAVSNYCLDFAKTHSLEAIRDSSNNVIIRKSATSGYENADPVILQGHLDMVCVKEENNETDFAKDGIKICNDGEFIKAEGTSLGADNGIAVAMILAILESEEFPHPPIEAVFTTDEEIGMLGASALDTSLLKSKKMINLDAEEDDTVTVSCAGGSDFKIVIPTKRKTVHGFEATVVFGGLAGGHSGIEIDKNRVNADILAGRFLNHLKTECEFEIIAVNGGNKRNVIPDSCTVSLCVYDPEMFKKSAENYLEILKGEFYRREPDFSYKISVSNEGEYDVLSDGAKNDLIFTLVCVHDGVAQMSSEIAGLVESSSNLGVLKTEGDEVILLFMLRGNKESSLRFLEEKMTAFSSHLNCRAECTGHYPPWEYKEDSDLREIFKECYKEQYGVEAKAEAIHAGLECGVFSSGIEGLDCIAMGPRIFDVHTVKERLSVSSLENTYKLLLEILKRLNNFESKRTAPPKERCEHG